MTLQYAEYDSQYRPLYLYDTNMYLLYISYSGQRIIRHPFSQKIWS